MTHNISDDFIVLLKELMPINFFPLRRLTCLTIPFFIIVLMGRLKIRKKECNVPLQSRGEVRLLDWPSFNFVTKNLSKQNKTHVQKNIVHTKLDEK